MLMLCYVSYVFLYLNISFEVFPVMTRLIFVYCSVLVTISLWSLRIFICDRTVFISSWVFPWDPFLKSDCIYLILFWFYFMYLLHLVLHGVHTLSCLLSAIFFIRVTIFFTSIHLRWFLFYLIFFIYILVTIYFLAVETIW